VYFELFNVNITRLQRFKSFAIIKLVS